MASSKLTKWPKIFLFGDSLTQASLSKDGCWGSLIGDYFQRRCDVVVRGFSGYNTRHCQYVLPKVLDDTIAKETVALTIFLGANDAALQDLNPQQHVPLEEYKTNLKALVDHCLSVGISRDKIIMITPPALGIEAWTEDRRQKGLPVTRTVETSSAYAKACYEVAKEIGVTGIDLYGAMMKLEDYRPYLNDGLHLGEKGSHLLFDLLKPVLEKLTNHIPPLIFPDWKIVDNNNPESSFKDC